MARGVNKAIIIGSLGADPEVKYLANGTAVTTLSIATNEKWKSKETGQEQERTDWHRVKFFGRMAEICGEYLKKGRQIYIEGKNRSDKYQDSQGNDKWDHYILGEEMQMLGGGEGQSGGQRNNPARRQTQLDQRTGGNSQHNGYGSPGPQFDDDDIPF